MRKRKQMLGLWLENRSLAVRDDLPMPAVTSDEALIRVIMAGICGTDLQLLKGYYPFTGIPGHEFVGEVIEAPAAPHIIGKRVTGEINIPCGYCHVCNMGLPKHCLNRQVLGIKNRNGAFAQYLSLPIGNLHIVPDMLSDDRAVFSEPVAAAAQILHQVTVTPDSKVLVVGAGRLGLLIAQVLQTTRCRLQVVARYNKQHRILQHFGIAATTEQRLPEGAMDIVVEATGCAAGLESALRAVRPAGTIVLKSTYAAATKFQFSRIVVDEIKIVGSRCGPFQSALEKLTEASVDPTPLIEGRFPLQDANEAFVLARQPGVLKVLLQGET